MGKLSFQRLQNELTQRINSLPAGSQLPSEPALAAELHVSRATLREAMRSFEAQGLIRRRQGLGTFVVGEVPLIDSGLELLESIETMASRKELKVSFGSLVVEDVNAEMDVSAAMGIQVGSPLTRVGRVIFTDERPAAYLVDLLPKTILDAADLGADFSGSVLDLLLRRHDLQKVNSRTQINAVSASPELARLLEVQRGDVLLQFIADLYAEQGLVIDHSISYFLPGYFSFHVNRRVS